MDSLVRGYRRFRTETWPQQRRIFEALAERGQRPSALVIACIDSRVDPATIFDTAPGDMLVVRNVANLVPPYAPDNAYHGTSAALEFGVRVLEVPRLIVLGHSGCGGVQALMGGAPAEAGDFIATWMSIAEPARQTALKETRLPERQLAAEQDVVRLSLRNLMSFPWIAERAAAGKLTLVGAWFSIETGTLMLLQGDGAFAAVTEN